MSAKYVNWGPGTNGNEPSVADMSLDDPGFLVGSITDVGRVRELNEDNLHWAPLTDDLVLYAVADGMGGHDKGEVASRIAVESLFEVAIREVEKLDDFSVPGLREMLRESMQAANRAVVTTGEEQESNMGTTLCSALVHNERDAYVANVGDSRVYVIRGDKLVQVSQDHSLVAYLSQVGELTPEEARNHPSGNILVRSVGSVSEVEIDLYHVPMEPGDGLLLCSDGLWGELTDDDLERILKVTDGPQAACQRMVDEANENGGRDNTTLIVVRV